MSARPGRGPRPAPAPTSDAVDALFTATEVAGDLPMTRQAVAKHLQILGDAGLVHAERVGRETRFEATTEPLRAVTDWIAQTDTAWSHRLHRLEEQVRRVGRPR